MSLPLKASAVALTVSSIGGVAYLGSTYLSKTDEIIDQKQPQEEEKVEEEVRGKPITTLIKEKFKYVLLDTKKTGDSKLDAFWKTNWENYNTQNASSEAGKDPLKLTGWTKGNKTNLTAQLKVACEKVFSNTVPNNTDPTFQNVEKYCARGVTVEEDALKKGITILDTKENGTHSTTWDKRLQDKVSLKPHLEKIGITQSQETLTKKNISDGCETAKSKNRKQDDYDAIYKAYEKVCAKQDGDPT